jgi:hypothetical protein
MRGFPPLHLFLLGMAFCLLAVPLAQLTGNVTHAEVTTSVPAKPGDAPVKAAAVIRVRYAHKPLTVSLKKSGQELLPKLDLSASPTETRAEIDVSKGGHELEVTATWPPGTPDTALTLEIEPDGFETRSETRWSSTAALNEIITLNWQ